MINRKKFLKIVFVLVLSFLLVNPTVLLAQGGGGEIIDPWAGEGGSATPGDALGRLQAVGGEAYGTGASAPKSPAQIAGEVIKIGLNVIGVVFLTLLLYGGFLWMTARGNEERITKAKNTLEAAGIGLVIVFAAYGITYFVVDRVFRNVTGSG